MKKARSAHLTALNGLSHCPAELRYLVRSGCEPLPVAPGYVRAV